MLLKFKMVDSKESKCPFLSGVKLGDLGSSPLVDNSLYQQLVESLLYLTQSQPDLDYETMFKYICRHLTRSIRRLLKGYCIMCKESNTLGYTMMLVLHQN